MTFGALAATNDIMHLVHDSLFWSQVRVDPEPWLAEEIRALEDPLADTYLAVKNASPNARVFVQGYPRLFPDNLDMSCEFIRADGTAFLNEMAAELDAVIGRAAQGAGVDYVNVYDGFSGHELCTDGSYIHGIDKSDAAFGPQDAFFHPTVGGHHRFSDLLVDAIEGRGSAQALGTTAKA